jgi:poly-gamma-glutamate capsule biosynthesis protein CapA/YwtB (metallophosphatase superfamily)
VRSRDYGGASERNPIIGTFTYSGSRRWLRRLSSAIAVVPLVVTVAAGATVVRVHDPSVVANASPVHRNVMPPAGAHVRRPPPEPRRVTIAFTGDILIHRGVWERAAADATGGARFDFRPMFRAVRPILSKADLAICHLETPLSPDDADLSSYPVFATPHEVADAIAWAGYDGCSTASNHSIDDGATGVDATLRWLDHAGLQHAGTARNSHEAERITTYRVDGLRVAHLSYAFGFNGFTPDTAWRANRIVVPRILADAHRARRSGADLVVVSLHWGTEYQHDPIAWQQTVARTLTRSPDIDLIVGHHAHVVQPVTRLNGTWVVYGLGNFLSGMTDSLGTPAVEDGEIVLATAEQRGNHWRVTGISFVPTWVEYGTWRVLSIVETLGGAWPSATLRAILRASWQRTVEAVDLLGAGGLGVRPGGALPKAP